MALRHLVQHLAVLLQHRQALRDALVVDQRGQVVPDRRAELGLLVELVQHVGQGGQAGGVALPGLGRDAGCAGGRLQFGEAGLQRGFGRGVRWRLGRRGQRQQQHGQGEQAGGGGHGASASGSFSACRSGSVVCRISSSTEVA